LSFNFDVDSLGNLLNCQYGAKDDHWRTQVITKSPSILSKLTCSIGGGFVFSLKQVKVRVSTSTTLFKVGLSRPLISLSIRVTKSHTYKCLKV